MNHLNIWTQINVKLETTPDVLSKFKNILEEDRHITQTIFKLVFSLNQVMFRRHHGRVLDHCKNEHSHKYTNAQRPGLPEWAQEGEEFSWSSWLLRSVATARSSLPVDEWWLWMNELCTICETQHSVSISCVALSCCSFVCSVLFCFVTFTFI